MPEVEGLHANGFSSKGPLGLSSLQAKQHVRQDLEEAEDSV